jgi:hypothetical protein
MSCCLSSVPFGIPEALPKYYMFSINYMSTYDYLGMIVENYIHLCTRVHIDYVTGNLVYHWLYSHLLNIRNGSWAQIDMGLPFSLCKTGWV